MMNVAGGVPYFRYSTKKGNDVIHEIMRYASNCYNK